ncbi:hypothetical protein [Crossiella sp. NPDC003009]
MSTQDNMAKHENRQMSVRNRTHRVPTIVFITLQLVAVLQVLTAPSASLAGRLALAIVLAGALMAAYDAWQTQRAQGWSRR